MALWSHPAVVYSARGIWDSIASQRQPGAEPSEPGRCSDQNEHPVRWSYEEGAPIGDDQVDVFSYGPCRRLLSQAPWHRQIQVGRSQIQRRLDEEADLGQRSRVAGGAASQPLRLVELSPRPWPGPRPCPRRADLHRRAASRSRRRQRPGGSHADAASFPGVLAELAGLLTRPSPEKARHEGQSPAARLQEARAGVARLRPRGDAQKDARQAPTASPYRRCGAGFVAFVTERVKVRSPVGCVQLRSVYEQSLRRRSFFFLAPRPSLS